MFELLLIIAFLLALQVVALIGAGLAWKNRHVQRTVLNYYFKAAP